MIGYSSVTRPEKVKSTFKFSWLVSLYIIFCLYNRSPRYLQTGDKYDSRWRDMAGQSKFVPTSEPYRHHSMCTPTSKSHRRTTHCQWISNWILLFFSPWQWEPSRSNSPFCIDSEYFHKVNVSSSRLYYYIGWLGQLARRKKKSIYYYVLIASTFRIVHDHTSCSTR